MLPRVSNRRQYHSCQPPAACLISYFPTDGARRDLGRQKAVVHTVFEELQVVWPTYH